MTKKNMSNLWKQLDHHEWTDVQHGRVRERLVRFMQATRPAEQAPARAWSWMMLPRLATVGVTALVVLLGGSGVAVAAARDSAPYDTLYPVRVFAEELRTKLTRDPVKRVELAVKFSEARLVEMRNLATMQAAEEGRGRADVVVSADKRLKAFERSGRSMRRLAHLAERHVATLREERVDGEADELAAQLDAVLDASVGILLSVETNAPANEPVRAVVAKIKLELSPVESKAEQVSNEYAAKVLERFTKIEKEEDEEEDEDEDKKDEDNDKDELAVTNEDEVRTNARIEAAERIIGRAKELMRETEEQYGAEAVADMRAVFKRAETHLEKAEELFVSGAYQPAFLEAGEAIKIAAHIKVYLPIIEKRAKVLVDENTQLRLYILPKYLDDLKSTTTK